MPQEPKKMGQGMKKYDVTFRREIVFHARKEILAVDDRAAEVITDGIADDPDEWKKLDWDSTDDEVSVEELKEVK